MVKRKAECSPGFIPDTEESGPECELPKELTNLEPMSLIAVPIGSHISGETTNYHVLPLPANVAEEGGEVVEAFWSLLAAAGYQVW